MNANSKFGMRACRAAASAVALLAVSLFASNASAGVSQWIDGFEGSAAGDWWFAGNAGIDYGRGLAHSGDNNGWVRAFSGWNAVNASVTTYPGAICTVVARIRSSQPAPDGYMSVRSWSDGLPILSEIHVNGGWPDPSNADYDEYSFDFVADAYSALFYVGLWGNGQDTWLQVDDVGVSCPTPY